MNTLLSAAKKWSFPIAAVLCLAVNMGCYEPLSPVKGGPKENTSDTLSQDTLSQDTLSQDTLSQDTLSQDTLSQDTLSQDTLEHITLTLGSVAHNLYGASFDADEMKNYVISEMNENIKNDIDVWFSNGKFYSPVAAARTGDFAPRDWTILNATTFIKVPANFDAITGQSQIDALWTPGAAVDVLPLSPGDVVIINTSKGVKRMVKISAVDSTAAGTAVVVGLK